MSKAVIEEILNNNLIEQTARVGDILYSELERLALKHPDQIKNLRGKGKGTFIAFDTPDSAALVRAMKLAGVNIGTCGINTVRLRPMLIFEESHVPTLVNTLDSVLSNL
jgi:4-aminobutyrate aminotransferase/(S)-3-amino-2-methylpropionate transaminase